MSNRVKAGPEKHAKRSQLGYREILAEIQRLLYPAEPGDTPAVLQRLESDHPYEKIALAKIYAEKIATSDRVRAQLHRPEGETPSDSAPPLLQTFWDETNDGPLTIFFESGSTILRASLALRDRLGSNSRVYTNNNLTGILYLSAPASLSRPYIFPGFLERKYEGTFPFLTMLHQIRNPDSRHDEERRRDIESRNAQIAMEQKGYAQCRNLLQSCDLLLLATSRLSLLYGPMIGSRENAIFKHATFNALVPPLLLTRPPRKQEAHMLVPCQKIVSSEKRFPDTLEDEMARIAAGSCYPVFDIPLDDARGQIRSPFNEIVSDRDPLEDGTEAVHFQDVAFRVCSTWSELFCRAKLTLRVFVSYPVADEKGRNWLQLLRDEVHDVQRSCRGQMKLQFFEYPASTYVTVKSKSYGVACIVISPPKP